MKQAMFTVATVFLLTACHAKGVSVLDIFPDSGVKVAPTEAVCSFDYEPSGSQWIDGVDETSVFLASVKGDGWRLGIGKGGQIYSLRGPFGESVPPQREASPWNDEVWQAVITSEELIGPVHDYQNANPQMREVTTPLMYFIHQAGIYTKGAGVDNGTAPAPFYSPCLRKRWNSETRSLEVVNWMQQAHTPCVWKSGVLIYTAYRDLGEGVVEVNQVIHNFGTETLGFLNTPWGGVRHSSLPYAIISNPDGSWEEAKGIWDWTGIPTRALHQTGGWEAWTQDPGKDDSPALALVFGMSRPGLSKKEANDQVIRWGTAGDNEVRDYQVTERICHIRVAPGDSLAIRWHLVAGEFLKVRTLAAELAEKAGVQRLQFDCSAKQPVWLSGGKVATEGEGEPWIELCAFPAKGTVPVFLLEDKRTGEQIITADPYALAETESYPNPLPADLKIHDIYDNRVVYKQYAPHIGYENLLGYAYPAKPAGRNVQKIKCPEGVVLHDSAQKLWTNK